MDGNIRTITLLNVSISFDGIWSNVVMIDDTFMCIEKSDARVSNFSDHMHEVTCCWLFTLPCDHPMFRIDTNKLQSTSRNRVSKLDTYKDNKLLLKYRILSWSSTDVWVVWPENTSCKRSHTISMKGNVWGREERKEKLREEKGTEDQTQVCSCYLFLWSRLQKGQFQVFHGQQTIRTLCVWKESLEKST